MLELRAAWAITLKDLRSLGRYRLQLPSLVFGWLYQSIIPAFLFGASFAVGGRNLGLASSLGTEDLAGFLFMGGVVGAILSTSFWVVAFSLRMEMDAGTLEPSWLTPTRRETIVLGRGLYAVVLLVLVQAALFAIGMAFFGLRVRADALLALPALLVAMAGMAGFAYLITAAVLLLKEANIFVDTTNLLLGILSGITFPITFLPLAAQAVAVMLPTTWAVEILRAHALGSRTVLDLRVEYALLLATTLGTLPLGLWAFRAADRHMRAHGTVTQY